MDICGDGGVVKEVLKEGGGAVPNANDTVQVHFVGRIHKGAEFDSSYTTGYPINVNLEESKVVPGWLKVIPTMTLGEKCRVVLQPEYGYGAAGSDGIPPDAVLEFDMELTGIKVARNQRADADRARLAEVRAARAEAAKERAAKQAEKQERQRAVALKKAEKQAGRGKKGKKGKKAKK